MTSATCAWLELGLFVLVLTAVTPLLGRYLAAVFGDGPHPVRRRLEGVERAIYRVCRIDPAREMTWTGYLAAVLTFTAVTIVALFALLACQQWLPLNPQRFPNVAPLLALYVAVSFATTTNWQAYSGESTLGYLAQMAGLAWQNFVAAAIGLAVAIAAIRGSTRSGVVLPRQLLG